VRLDAARLAGQGRFGPGDDGARCLPDGACGGRTASDVVIDFRDAKKRLKSQEEVWKPAPIQTTLALAEEFRGHLDAGGVNQSDLARRHGLTQARVTSPFPYPCSRT
jgi:hypothetical protein